jgi:hypothetical protein
MLDPIGNIARKIEVMPWRIWFAWRPVTTVSNERVWLRKIYRRQIVSYVDMDDWMHYEYGNIFDILKK